MPRRCAKPSAAASPPAAGLLRRLAAIVYDSLLLVGVLFAATLAALALRGGTAFAPGDPLFTAYLLTVVAGFFGWFWTHGGQTLGMRAWKLRLVALDRSPVTWRQALLRAAAALLSAVCLGLGYLWVAVDPERRAWHDRVSGTRVVREN
jgi:uncharacterized RDD family membrane protein YckC